MPRQYHNARQLPLDRSPETMKVKLSQTITIKCPRCNYAGFEKVVTGRSSGPIYKCPECNTLAQKIEAKK